MFGFHVNFPECTTFTYTYTPPTLLSRVTSASPLAASPPRLRAKAMPCGASRRSHKSWIPWKSSGAWSWHTRHQAPLTPANENWQKMRLLMIFGWDVFCQGKILNATLSNTEVRRCFFRGFWMWRLFLEEPFQVLKRKRKNDSGVGEASTQKKSMQC